MFNGCLKGGAKTLCCVFATHKNFTENQRPRFFCNIPARLDAEVALHVGYDSASSHVRQKSARKTKHNPANAGGDFGLRVQDDNADVQRGTLYHFSFL